MGGQTDARMGARHSYVPPKFGGGNNKVTNRVKIDH